MRAKVLNWIFILLIVSSGLSQAQNKVRYTAVPIDGYTFKSWDDGNTTNGRIIDLTSIPAELSSVPQISVSEPTTMTTIKLADNILTSTRGVVLYEILDDNTDTPLNTLASSVVIPALKASFNKKPTSIGNLEFDVDGNLVATEYSTCESINIHLIFKPVPSGTAEIGNAVFTTTYDYYMLESEITQREWKLVMGCSNNPSHYNNLEACPVENVSWYDAIYFCNKLSGILGLEKVYSISGTKNETQWGSIPTSNNSTWNAVVCDWTANGVRLPTEVEWMHAAKEGTNADYIYSGTSTDLEEYAWISSTPGCGSRTHIYKTKAPNALGLYDMTGNVWEWCWDRYGTWPTTDQTDYKGPDSGTNRINKGSCYAADAPNAKLEIRENTAPSTKSTQRGFRIVIANVN
ncbi:MAG: SUMF1/EgtB/PvdO family nonheme iron enzyme [Bacteroidetes bacterium]|nr:SUMF1/EgtB/PvdO family nonheme iron enzyme [Bacteroidota bacterium]